MTQHIWERRIVRAVGGIVEVDVCERCEAMSLAGGVIRFYADPDADSLYHTRSMKRVPADCDEVIARAVMEK